MFGRMIIAIALPFAAIFGPMVAAGAAVKWLGEGWEIPAAIGVLIVSVLLWLAIFRR